MSAITNLRTVMLMLEPPQLLAPGESPEKANIQSQNLRLRKSERQLKETGSVKKTRGKKNPIKLHEEQMRSQDKPVLRAPKTAISP